MKPCKTVSPNPSPSVPDGPLHHDMATSPFKRTYADAGIFSKTPTKPRLSSVAGQSLVSLLLPESKVALRSGLFSLSDRYFSDRCCFRKSFCVHYRCVFLGSYLIPAYRGAVADDGSIPTKKSDRQEADALFGGIVSQPIPKPTFTSVSPVARALVPADWDQRYGKLIQWS